MSRCREDLTPSKGSRQGSFLASAGFWWPQASLAYGCGAPISASLFPWPPPLWVSYKDTGERPNVQRDNDQSGQDNRTRAHRPSPAQEASSLPTVTSPEARPLGAALTGARASPGTVQEANGDSAAPSPLWPSSVNGPQWP